MNYEEFCNLGSMLKETIFELYCGDGSKEDDLKMLRGINSIIVGMVDAFEEAKDEAKTFKKRSLELYGEKLRLEKELKELKGEDKES